jgi:hypothetical protein
VSFKHARHCHTARSEYRYPDGASAHLAVISDAGDLGAERYAFLAVINDFA